MVQARKFLYNVRLSRHAFVVYCGLAACRDKTYWYTHSYYRTLMANKKQEGHV